MIPPGWTNTVNAGVKRAERSRCSATTFFGVGTDGSVNQGATDSVHDQMGERGAHAL